MSIGVASWWKCIRTSRISTIISFAFMPHFDMFFKIIYNSKCSIAFLTFKLFNVRGSLMSNKFQVRSIFCRAYVAHKLDFQVTCIHVISQYWHRWIWSSTYITRLVLPVNYPDVTLQSPLTFVDLATEVTLCVFLKWEDL